MSRSNRISHCALRAATKSIAPRVSSTSPTCQRTRLSSIAGGVPPTSKVPCACSRRARDNRVKRSNPVPDYARGPIDVATSWWLAPGHAELQHDERTVWVQALCEPFP